MTASTGGRPRLGLVLQDFAKTIGEEAALQIAVRFGGRQLYVAHKPARDSELVRIIGADAAVQLGKRCGGISYTIPTSAAKSLRIVQLRKDGLTHQAIAERERCTERYVYRVMRDYLNAGGELPPIVNRARRKRRRSGRPAHRTLAHVRHRLKRKSKHRPSRTSTPNRKKEP